MYQYLIVVLKIEKSVGEIIQEVGVRQGDKKAPRLFLFLMAAFDEILKDIWEENNLIFLDFNECLTMILIREKEL